MQINGHYMAFFSILSDPFQDFGNQIFYNF